MWFSNSRAESARARQSGLVLALLAAAVLSACGSDDDSPASSGTSSSTSSSVSSSSSSRSSSSSSVSSSTSSSASSSVSSSASSSADVSSSSSSSSAASFASADLDSNGWFWFNSDTSALKYLIGATLSSGTKYNLDAAQAATGSQFIMVSNGSGGVGTGYGTYDSTGQATSSGVVYSTHTGSISLVKATNLGSLDGGAAIFKLPSVSGFQFVVAGTGSMCYSVDVSTDNGTTWTNKYGVTATGTCGTGNAVHAKGDWTDDVSSSVGTISSSVWVRILNKASGSLQVHGVKITP